MATAQSVDVEKIPSEDSMATSNLIRWGGPAAVLGGLLIMFGSFFSYDHWIYAPLYAAADAFMVVGITGTYLYLRHSGRFGLSGTVGFYMCVFAFVVDAILSLGVILNVWGAQWYETFGAINLLVILGLALFGVAILRSGRLPRIGAELLIATSLAEVGVIVAMAVSGYTLPDWVWSVPAVLFAIGWMWLGYGLWSESRTSAGQLSRVS
jgi:hypothetical protein